MIRAQVVFQSQTDKTTSRFDRLFLGVTLANDSILHFRVRSIGNVIPPFALLFFCFFVCLFCFVFFILLFYAFLCLFLFVLVYLFIYLLNPKDSADIQCARQRVL